MGTSNLHAFLKQKGCQVVAACDVDKEHLASAVEIVNRHYQNNDCKAYNDFRMVTERADVDAVMIAVPDHWHELIAVEASRQKKDIYGEKPLARTIAEQQAIVRAVRENQGIWQTGSWQRSVAVFRKAAEIVRNGLIGDVTHVVQEPQVAEPVGRPAQDVVAPVFLVRDDVVGIVAADAITKLPGRRGPD